MFRRAAAIWRRTSAGSGSSSPWASWLDPLAFESIAKAVDSGAPAATATGAAARNGTGSARAGGIGAGSVGAGSIGAGSPISCGAARRRGVVRRGRGLPLIWFLPSDLAWYIARSAATISSSLVEPSSGCDTRPMLTLVEAGPVASDSPICSTPSRIFSATT